MPTKSYGSLDSSEQDQADKFAELARALECDEDEVAFDAKLRGVVKHKPLPEKPK